ncbi:MAG: hypothetical protein WD646_00765 [Actinomycetota bacterium]
MSQPRTHFPRFIAGVGGLLGLGLLLAGQAVASGLQDLLPGRAMVRSSGTFYPPFQEAGPWVLRGLGVAILLGTSTGLVVGSGVWSHATRWFARLRPMVAIAVLVVAAFVIYSLLAYPHNAFPSNARIHWVDIFFHRNDRFFYVLVKPLHSLFYDQPHLLQGLTGAGNVTLVYALGRRLLSSQWTAVAMAASFLASGLMMTFANGAEDVHINVAVLLFALLLYARRSRLLGLAIFVVTLGRPPFVVMVGAFVLTEVVISALSEEGSRLQSRLRRVLENRFLLQQVGLFAGLFVVWHTALAIAGVNWLFANGRLVDVPHLDFEPIAVGGFTISSMSMTYVLHSLWIFPAATLGANVLVVALFRRLTVDLKRAFIFIWLFVVMTVGIAEWFPMYYFNVRFLAYVFPFVLVGGWLVFGAVPEGQRLVPLRVGAAVLMLASTLAMPSTALETRNRVRESRMSAAFHDRRELRSLVGDASVSMDFGGRADRNYLAYVLRRPLDRIGRAGTNVESLAGVWFVLTSDQFRYQGAEVVWHGTELRLVELSHRESVDAAQRDGQS